MGDVFDSTGYKGKGDSSGTGGRARERSVMGAVDDASSGSLPPSSAAPSAPTKEHPAAYRPTPAERASRKFGAPIDAPILTGGGQ